MSRLLDEILRENLPASVKEMLKGTRLLVLDSVAKCLLEDHPQESWILQEDFTSFDLPFPNYFLECRAPNFIWQTDGKVRWPDQFPSAWGLHCIKIPKEQSSVVKQLPQTPELLAAMEAQELDRGLMTFLYSKGGSHEYGEGPWWYWEFAITKEGKLVSFPASSHPDEKRRQELIDSGHSDQTAVLTAPTSTAPEFWKMTAIQFGKQAVAGVYSFPLQIAFFLSMLLRCKGAGLNIWTPDLKLQKRTIERYGIPLSAYMEPDFGAVISGVYGTGQVTEKGFKAAFQQYCKDNPVVKEDDASTGAGVPGAEPEGGPVA